LSIQERLSFGPNREFILLKACDRILVVAAQNGQAVLLTDMASEEPASSAPAVQLAEESPLTYETVLSRATRRLDTARAPATTAPQAQSWPELEGVMR
jgi:flagellar biogenesis protein FliO